MRVSCNLSPRPINRGETSDFVLGLSRVHQTQAKKKKRVCVVIVNTPAEKPAKMQILSPGLLTEMNWVS